MFSINIYVSLTSTYLLLEPTFVDLRQKEDRDNNVHALYVLEISIWTYLFFNYILSFYIILLYNSQTRSDTGSITR